MMKALEVENSHPVILNFLEYNIVYLRDSIFNGEIKIKDLIKPPLRQTAFTDTVFSAQLNREPDGNLVGNRGGLGAGDSQGESDGSPDGRGE
jgi:hypothetical protein